MDYVCHSATAPCHMPETEEKAVIAGLWRDAELLLSGSSEELSNRIRQMQDQLPAACQLAPAEAARLAHLHIGSASNLMRTMRLTAPHIFDDDSSPTPNYILLLQLDGTELQLALSLIELQLFNLKRAAVLVTRAKQQVLTGSEASASSCASFLE